MIITLLEDFNLDLFKKRRQNYQFKNYFNDINDILGGKTMVQFVVFQTWWKEVKGQQRESLVDHVCLNDPCKISNNTKIKLFFENHVMISVTYSETTQECEIICERDWKNYSKSSVCSLLAKQDWSIEPDTAQA
jgi:hypothetical protein